MLISRGRGGLRNKRGRGLVEAVTAAFILIPIAFFLLDVTVLILASTMNDTAVKNAARAAASQSDFASGWQAANKSLDNFKSSSIVKLLKLTKVDSDPKWQISVTCETTMIVNVPIPVPGYGDIVFTGRATEPIVGAKSNHL